MLFNKLLFEDIKKSTFLWNNAPELLNINKTAINYCRASFFRSSGV